MNFYQNKFGTIKNFLYICTIIITKTTKEKTKL